MIVTIIKMIHRLGRGEPEKGPRLIKDGGVWCGFLFLVPLKY